MDGTMIEISGNGQTTGAYLSRSKSGSGPGVVVFHEWWGLDENTKQVADRFAEEGFTALAPDFFHGKRTSDPKEGQAMVMAHELADAESVITGSIEALASHATGEKVACVGFGMGGQLGVYAATKHPEIAACVNYYGVHQNVHPDYKKLNIPLMGFFAEYDEYAFPTVVSSVDLQLTELGKPHRFHTYDHTHHSFFNKDMPEVYVQEAADDSWAKMLTFFHKQLG